MKRKMSKKAKIGFGILGVSAAAAGSVAISKGIKAKKATGGIWSSFVGTAKKAEKINTKLCQLDKSMEKFVYQMDKEYEYLKQYNLVEPKPDYDAIDAMKELLDEIDKLSDENIVLNKDRIIECTRAYMSLKIQVDFKRTSSPDEEYDVLQVEDVSDENGDTDEAVTVPDDDEDESNSIIPEFGTFYETITVSKNDTMESVFSWVCKKYPATEFMELNHFKTSVNNMNGIMDGEFVKPGTTLLVPYWAEVMVYQEKEPEAEKQQLEDTNEERNNESSRKSESEEEDEKKE